MRLFTLDFTYKFHSLLIRANTNFARETLNLSVEVLGHI